MASKTVKIMHPDMEGVGECTPTAFDKVWKAKGFEVVEGELPAPAPVIVEDSVEGDAEPLEIDFSAHEE